MYRTQYCGAATEEQVGQRITVAGWVQRSRNKGALIFTDLRDRTGILQLVFDENSDRAVFETAASLRSEFCVQAEGVLRLRESVNPDIPTGKVELFVDRLNILSRSLTPPFPIEEGISTNEELRLRYRYLDLRRPDMQEGIRFRHKVTNIAHEYFDRNGFYEIETPDLIKSTPEGARDYLVPSRVFPGHYFALPQSPQLYKQLLMASGFDRYMQIARCFRDEDLRADRQPEFTQIDIEMSFVEQDDVMSVNEGFVRELFDRLLNIQLPEHFPRMPYAEAMRRFGSDKPDVRFGLELCPLNEAVAGTEFKPFAAALEKGLISAINVKGGAATLSRKEIDKLGEFVKTYRAKGLAYTRWTAENRSSSFEKFMTPEEIARIDAAMNFEQGDVLLVCADSNPEIVYAALGALRLNLGEKLGLIDHDKFAVLWVTDFPLFEYSEEEGRFMAKHHPFTRPNPEDDALIESDPGACRALAYDLVINGTEAGGGSIRIHEQDLQKRMFTALGFTPESAQERFGFLLDAFQYGVPPHGGMAYGLDRLVMLLMKKQSIRDVIAFPKVQNSMELMSQAPGTVDDKQLTELHIARLQEDAE